MSNVKCVQPNCRSSAATIAGSGKTSLNCTIRPRFFSPKPARGGPAALLLRPQRSAHRMRRGLPAELPRPRTGSRKGGMGQPALPAEPWRTICGGSASEQAAGQQARPAALGHGGDVASRLAGQNCVDPRAQRRLLPAAPHTDHRVPPGACGTDRGKSRRRSGPRAAAPDPSGSPRSATHRAPGRTGHPQPDQCPILGARRNAGGVRVLASLLAAMARVRDCPDACDVRCRLTAPDAGAGRSDVSGGGARCKGC